MSRRHCDELGVCKGLTPPCTGCTLPRTYRNPQPYAPGVIERHHRQAGKHLVRWLVRALCLATAAALVVGWVNGGVL